MNICRCAREEAHIPIQIQMKRHSLTLEGITTCYWKNRTAITTHINFAYQFNSRMYLKKMINSLYSILSNYVIRITDLTIVCSARSSRDNNNNAKKSIESIYNAIFILTVHFFLCVVEN